MANIVEELQREALDDSVSVSNLLRKAMVVARKLQVKDFSDWIESELNGYAEKTQIPSYGIVIGEVKAWNPYHGWIPVVFSDPREAEMLSKRPVAQSVGELENLLKRAESGSALQIPFPKDIEMTLMRGNDLGLVPTLMIDQSRVQGIIETVKTIILNWALKLEEDGILGESMSFSKKEKRTATATSYLVQNFIGNMNNSQIQQDTIKSTQVLTVGLFDEAKTKEFVALLKSTIKALGLSSSQSSELDTEIRTIDSQLTSSNPKQRIIVESLHSIRNILEGMAGSVLASGLLYELGKLIGS